MDFATIRPDLGIDLVYCESTTAMESIKSLTYDGFNTLTNYGNVLWVR